MIETFTERGSQLSSSRKLMEGDAIDYASALALVSVHSAIAFNDALLLKLTDKHEPSQDHAEAVTRAEKACKSKKLGSQGIKHLRKLIAAKTNVSYGTRKTTPEIAEALAVAAERFEKWVLPILK